MLRVISMLDESLASPGGFEAVWQRVQGARSAPPDTGGEQLREFMLAAGRACELYRALACRMGGCACTLRRMAEEESCRARALAGEYYLLTGDCCPPEPSCPLVCCCLKNLRSAYLAERESACAFRAAAERACGELKCLYERCARCEESHARTLRGIILRCI